MSGSGTAHAHGLSVTAIRRQHGGGGRCLRSQFARAALAKLDGCHGGGCVLRVCRYAAHGRGRFGEKHGNESLLEEVVAINAQLRILSKGATVSGKIFDKIMILDRKHRIKDKIVTVFSFAYDAVSKTASKVQSDMKDDDDDDNRGGERTRGDARRGDDRRGEPRRRDEGWRNEPRRSDERREPDNDVGGRRDEPRR